MESAKATEQRISSMPVSSLIYQRLRAQNREAPRDAFKEELSPMSISSKLALLGFISSLISVWSAELRAFTVASFLGFVVFSLFYGFFRFRSGA